MMVKVQATRMVNDCCLEEVSPLVTMEIEGEVGNRIADSCRRSYRPKHFYVNVTKNRFE